MKKSAVIVALAQLFLLATLTAPRQAVADTLSLDIGLTAHHFNRDTVRREDLNEVNPGLGLRWTSGDYHRMAGVYRNSIRRTSAYALLGYTPIHAGPLSLGVVAGAVTGYGKPYMAAAGFYAVAQVTSRAAVVLTVVPTIDSQDVDGFAGFQVSITF